MTYNTQNTAIEKVYAQLGISSTKKTHTGRGGTAHHTKLYDVSEKQESNPIDFIDLNASIYCYLLSFSSFMLLHCMLFHFYIYIIELVQELSLRLLKVSITPQHSPSFGQGLGMRRPHGVVVEV